VKDVMKILLSAGDESKKWVKFIKKPFPANVSRYTVREMK
jgi:hypothetical protein